MRACTRGPEPDLLTRFGMEISRDYATRRRENRHHRFQWPEREGQSLLAVLRTELRLMTNERCSYCDGHPIDATGQDTIDHFRPKGNPAFYELVCVWTNLFLTCSACNHAKGERWNEGLLRPDDPDFSFERYFEYRFDTGELHPNGAAIPDDQVRARMTIELLHLNRTGACVNRRRTIKWIGTGDRDVPYRYLIPLALLS
jgi:uncharacterized protein (TIGR02646 family)